LGLIWTELLLRKVVLGHGLAVDAVEKTVIASLFQSSLHSGTIFLWKIEAIRHVSRAQVMSYFYKKRPKNIMVPNWFFVHCNFSSSYLFYIRWQVKVFLYWISLGPKWKNLGSWDPSLVASNASHTTYYNLP